MLIQFDSFSNQMLQDHHFNLLMEVRNEMDQLLPQINLLL